MTRVPVTHSRCGLLILNQTIQTWHQLPIEACWSALAANLMHCLGSVDIRPGVCQWLWIAMNGSTRNVLHLSFWCQARLCSLETRTRIVLAALNRTFGTGSLVSFTTWRNNRECSWRITWQFSWKLCTSRVHWVSSGYMAWKWIWNAYDFVASVGVSPKWWCFLVQAADHRYQVFVNEICARDLSRVRTHLNLKANSIANLGHQPRYLETS